MCGTPSCTQLARRVNPTLEKMPPSRRLVSCVESRASRLQYPNPRYPNTSRSWKNRDYLRVRSSDACIIAGSFRRRCAQPRRGSTVNNAIGMRHSITLPITWKRQTTAKKEEMMNDTKTKTPPRLVIRRKLAAPRARVYAAWTKPEQMRNWAGPGDITAPEIESDLRVGGTYRIMMQKPDGERIAVRGVFREVREPKRLSYTWRWEEDSPDHEIDTLVTVEFRDLGDETELVLTHEQFASEESRDAHEGGWNGALDKLAIFLK
ncbi:MAG: SRPBCC family protein [Vulcanimicrobiaceae bacterium]